MTDPIQTSVNQIMPNRREVFLRCALLIPATGMLFGAVQPVLGAGNLTATEAYLQASTGKIMLVDIRTPGEWSDTGSGVGAIRLDMRRDDFEATLSLKVSGNKNAAIALICARGVRSLGLSRQLRDAGFTNIMDVPEGMLGSRAGIGWIARNLPLTKG